MTPFGHAPNKQVGKHLASFGDSRFKWGINIDDMWLYAGVQPPKSIIIPYLFSIRLPRGPIRVAPDSTPIEAIKSATRTVIGKEVNEPGDRAQFSKDLAGELKTRGVQFVRCWFQWNFFEPKIADSNPNYQFPLDDFVSTLTSSGIEIVAVIGNGYSRFLPLGINMRDVDGYLKKLDSSCRAIVRHYKESINTWQIENEPNWWSEHYATHWRSRGVWLEPTIHDSVLGTLHDLVREEDPSAKIVVNLEADHKKTNWMYYVKFADILGLDFYPNYARSSPVDGSEVKFSSEVKKQTGLSVFVAETGYPSGPSIFGYSPGKQVEYIKSAAEECFSCDDIFALSPWRYSDSYWRSFPDQENHFGLFERDGTPKPAWEEYCNQIRKKR
jgi:hypothetical protein